jgi:hypothetical protein
MSTDGWEGEGYDAEAGSGGGLWLRLKKRGEKVRLRLVSTPCRFVDTLEDEKTGESKQIRKVAWLAIHKEIINGQPSRRVVVFSNGPMVYGILKDLQEDENWGDPTQYDITVERTEESGKYYVVTPLPKPIGPISEEERALVAAADVDWPAICRKQRPAEAETATVGEATAEDPFV